MIWGGSCTVIVEDVRKKVIRSSQRCVLPAAVCFSSVFLNGFVISILRPYRSPITSLLYLWMIIHWALNDGCLMCIGYGNGFYTMLLTWINKVGFKLRGEQLGFKSCRDVFWFLSFNKINHTVRRHGIPPTRIIHKCVLTQVEVVQRLVITCLLYVFFFFVADMQTPDHILSVVIFPHQVHLKHGVPITGRALSNIKLC